LKRHPSCSCLLPSTERISTDKPELVVRQEHLQIFAAIKGVPQNSVDVQSMNLLEEVRLSDVADKFAGTFSGGMKRRLSVALAMVGNPSCLFLDEPTTGMDPISRRHVWDVIEKAKQDCCIVLTTHSMEEADILGDRVGIMAKGQLRCLGTPMNLKSKFGTGMAPVRGCKSV
jgi:ABC-type multidrug transport system ATPase subunit